MSAELNWRYPDAARAGLTSPSASRNRILEIVTSGNSSRSWSSTAPMLKPVRAGRPAAVMKKNLLELRARARSGEEHQAELADLHFVATGEHGLVDRLAVDVGAVEAADVDDHELATLTPELRVAARDRHVVEEDVRVGVPARARGVAVQQEARARVGTPLDHQQRRARGERVDTGDRGLGRRLSGLRLLQEVRAENRCPLRRLLRRDAGPVVGAHLSSPPAD